MMRPAENWEVLIACLRGEPPADADWEAIVEVANRTLLTPGLFDALSRASRLDVLPDEERTYLDFIHGCNLERNTRLRTQLVEAVGRLNSVGVEPTLLKGAVRLFCDPDGRLGSRMTRDLDLNVDEHEAEAPFGYPEIHWLTSPLRAASVRAGDPHAVNVWAGTGFRNARTGSVADIISSLT